LRGRRCRRIRWRGGILDGIHVGSGRGRGDGVLPTRSRGLLIVLLLLLGVVMMVVVVVAVAVAVAMRYSLISRCVDWYYCEDDVHERMDCRMIPLPT